VTSSLDWMILLIQAPQFGISIPRMSSSQDPLFFFVFMSMCECFFVDTFFSSLFSFYNPERP
jgi:hypothetical protein